jgi:thiol-disulfide isomerase/thioredoxin
VRVPRLHDDPAPARPRAPAGTRLCGALLVAALAWLPPALAQGGALKETFRQKFVGRPAPPLVLRDLKGRTVRLSDHRGKVVILNFWFSTCGPCRMETPDLVTLHQAYRKHGLEILGINMDELLIPHERGRQFERFLETYRMPYPILIADAKVYRDYGSAPIQPISFLVDREGVVRRVFWGAMSGGAFERAIRPYLFAGDAGPGSRPAPPRGADRPPPPAPRSTPRPAP